MTTEATNSEALAIGIRMVKQGLSELEDGRGYDDRGSVEMELRGALSFLEGVEPR